MQDRSEGSVIREIVISPYFFCPCFFERRLSYSFRKSLYQASTYGNSVKIGELHMTTLLCCTIDDILHLMNSQGE